MATTIAILDDEPDRLRAMTAALSRRFPELQVATFGNAPEMIAWLDRNLSSVALISLDHDLMPEAAGQPDPGTGRDVADYLATRRPLCHVIIHTTNGLAAPGMQMVLDESGWPSSLVAPYNDLQWVTTWWIREVAGRLPSGFGGTL
jgi:DNA-binding NtrC family response regulator